MFLVETEGEKHPPWLPQPGVFGRTLANFQDRVIRLSSPTAKLTKSRFVETRPSRTRKLYQHHLERLETGPIKRNAAYLSTFVKAEKEDRSSKPDPVPRMINPRSPSYNIELGCYVLPAEHTLYRAINKLMGYTAIAKGLNLVERASVLRSHWDSFTRPVALVLDVSRFDQHVHEEALRYEHGFYKRLYNNDPFLSLLLEWQINNIGFADTADGVVRYTIRGKRMSGDMNTALGNVILMCAMIYTFIQMRRIRARILDDGDDCVCIVEQRDLRYFDTIQEYYKALGFKLKIESTHSRFEEITFCQTQPVFDGTRWVMCRRPTTTLDKDLISVRPLESETAWRNHATSLSFCGASLAGNLPVYWKFYSMLDLNGRVNLEHQKLRYVCKGLDPKTLEPTTAARVSFYLAFDITPDEQIQLENYYSNMQLAWQPAPHMNLLETDSLISELY